MAGYFRLSGSQGSADPTNTTSTEGVPDARAVVVWTETNSDVALASAHQPGYWETRS